MMGFSDDNRHYTNQLHSMSIEKLIQAMENLYPRGSNYWYSLTKIRNFQSADSTLWNENLMKKKIPTYHSSKP